MCPTGQSQAGELATDTGATTDVSGQWGMASPPLTSLTLLATDVIDIAGLSLAGQSHRCWLGSSSKCETTIAGLLAGFFF